MTTKIYLRTEISEMYAVRKLGTNWGVPPLDRLIQAHKVFVLSSILNITELGDYKVGRGKILKCVHKSLEILIFFFKFLILTTFYR